MDSWFSSVAGGTPVVNQSALWANRAAFQAAGNTVRFTDVGGGTTSIAGGSYWAYIGTTPRWKLMNGQALLDAIDTANAGTANTTPQNLNPNAAAIPAGVIQGFDRIYLRLKASKSGAVDTASIAIRVGSTRTTADATIHTFTGMAAANVSGGFLADFKRISATSIQRQGSSDANASLAGAASGAYPSVVNLAGADSFDTSILYLTVWQTMTGGTEFITIQDMSLTLESTDS